MALSVPPVNLYYLAWLGLVPLFIALEKPQKKGFSEGLIAGIVFNTGILYWFSFNSGTHTFIASISMIAVVALLSVGWGVASYLFILMKTRIGRIAWLFVPFSWTAWEGWLSNMGEIAFPWSLLALTQTRFEAILQVMEFTGIWGVSFWVVAINTVIFFIWQNKTPVEKRIAFIVFILLVIIPPAALLHAFKYYDDRQPTVGTLVVQGNLDPREKWIEGADYSWNIYDSLTRSVGDQEVDLVIWPETALPAHLIAQSHFIHKLSDLTNDLNLNLLTGAPGYCRVDDDIHSLNSAFLIHPGQAIVDQYSKRQLVPFGERIPFQWIYPKLGELSFGQAEFLPGLRPTLFEVFTRQVRINFPALICFESAFPQMTKDLVKRGANLLVTISNDAWFGRTSEPYQISELSRFRCIETRRSMARAANTGISFLADPLGRIIKQSDIFESDCLFAELPVLSVKTFYVRYGNLFLMIVTLVYGAGLIFALIKNRES